MADVVCVYDPRIQKCKCRIINWKCVTVGVGMLQFHMADVVCVVSRY
jgi:hypothetical protein